MLRHRVRAARGRPGGGQGANAELALGRVVPFAESLRRGASREAAGRGQRARIGV
jgi:hypothetical protein